MTDNETIKALKDAVICIGQAPFVEKVTKGEQLKFNIIDLINRKQAVNELQAKEIVNLKIKVEQQKAEIERLTNKLEQREEMMANLGVELTTMRGTANYYKMHYDKSQVENKRLKDWEERNRIYENLQETNSELEEYRKAYVKAKSEAIKEFWKKIKRVIKKHICFFTPKDESELIQYGDNLVKEMTKKHDKD